MIGLKVGMIVGDINPRKLGGAEIHAVELMRRLAAHEHEIHALVGPSTEIKRILSSKRIHVYPVEYRQIKNLKSLAYVLRAKQVSRSSSSETA